MKTYRHELAASSDALTAAASEALGYLRYGSGPVGDRRVTVTMRAHVVDGRVRWVADELGDERYVEHAADSALALAIVVEDMLDVVLSQGDVGMRLSYAQDLAWALSIDVQRTEDFRRIGAVHVRLARFVELCARELATRAD